MLEIVFVRWFYRHLANAAEKKGRTRAWGWLGVAFWFAGETAGIILGLGMGGGGAGVYGPALVAAGVGAAVASGVVSGLPDLTREENAPLQF